MNSNQNISSVTSIAIDMPVPANDNVPPGGLRDTTPLVARPDVVRSIRATLRRYRVAPQDMADAIADVQTESIEAARSREMPASVAQWKALTATIAVHWAIDRRREAKARPKYDAGLCHDADAYPSPTLHWEHRDPVDTKRYLAVLKELFDAGEMPEDADEILVGEADGVPRAQIAAEIGVSTSVLNNRLFRMRANFRAKLAALGMLTFVLLLLGVLLLPMAVEVAGPDPRKAPTEAAPRVGGDPSRDGGEPPAPKNRPRPSNQIAPFTLK